MIVAGFSTPVPREVGHLVFSVIDTDWTYTDLERDAAEISYPLETHICTDQELGLAESGGDKPRLYPLANGDSDYWLRDG